MRDHLFIFIIETKLAQELSLNNSPYFMYPNS